MDRRGRKIRFAFAKLDIRLTQLGHYLNCTISCLHEQSFPAYGGLDSLIRTGPRFPEGVKSMPGIDYTLIHGGLPKTATTAIQRYLFPEHPDVHYFGKYALTGEPFRPREAWALDREMRHRWRLRLGRSHHGVLRRQAANAQSKGLVPVWSEEFISGNDQAAKIRRAKLFRNVFGKCRFLLFVREPVSLMESKYSQCLRAFHRKMFIPIWGRRIGLPPKYFTIEQWLAAIWDTPKTGAFGSLMYADTVDIFAEAFGRENVKVLPYEQLKHARNDCLRELSAFAGINAEKTVPLMAGKRANTRWTSAQLNRLKELEKPWWNTIRFSAMKPRQRREWLLDDVPGNQLDGQPLKVEMPASWRQRVLDLTRDQNRRLIDEYGVELESHGYAS